MELIFTSKLRNSVRFMKTEGSLPSSQSPAFFLYSEPDEASQPVPSSLFNMYFNIMLLYTPTFSMWFLLLVEVFP